MTPDAQVLLQTSMAETQRRQARDQAELQLKDKELASKIQLDMDKMNRDYEEAMEEQKLRLAIALGDMETKERIETARLTRDAARLKFDQDKTAFNPTQGGPNGYQ